MGAARSGASSAAAVVVVATIAAGLLRQGAFYPDAWPLLAAGVLLATVLAASSLRSWFRAVAAPPVVAVLLLAGWALGDGALHGDRTGGLPTAMLCLGVAAVTATVIALPGADRALVGDGMCLIGGLLAVTAWCGVALRLPWWAQQGQGLWRASGALTYPNATAAILAMLALWTLARSAPGVAGGPGMASSSGRLDAAPPLTALMLGTAAATLSRGGMLALTVGLAVLLAAGGKGLWRLVVGPLAGGVVVAAGLVPSLPADRPSRPAIAVLALVAGAVLARWHPVSPPAGVDRRGRRPLRRPVLAVALAVCAALAVAVVAVGDATFRHGLATVVDVRGGAGTAHRGDAASAALDRIRTDPLTGDGPGAGQVTWHDGSGAAHTMRYVHDEYLQTVLELGAVGGVLLLALIGTAIAWAASGRPGPATRPAWSGAVAAVAVFAVHSGLDFLWHLPALPLLAGAALALTGPDGVRHRSSGPPEAGEAIDPALLHERMG